MKLIDAVGRLEDMEDEGSDWSDLLTLRSMTRQIQVITEGIKKEVSKK